MNRRYEETLTHTSCLLLNVKGLIPNTISNEARSSNPMINQIALNRGAQRIWNKRHRNTGNEDQVADEAEVEGAQGVVNPTNIMTIRISDRLPSRPSLSLQTSDTRRIFSSSSASYDCASTIVGHTAIDNGCFFH